MAATPATAAVTDFGQYAKLRADAKSQNPEALKTAAKQFEALFLQQMLKSMRDASLGEDIMGGEQTEFYQDLFDQQLAVHLSAGKGFGLAEAMLQQLQRQQAASTPAIANSLPPLAGEGQDGGVATSDALLVTQPPPPHPSPASGGGGNFRSEFVQQLMPHAEKAAAALGVSPKTLIAQAALETDWGRRMIRQSDGSSSLNFFGIKADKRWEGERATSATTEYVNGNKTSETAQFRAYGSIAEAFDDYARFIQGNPRYRQALAHGGSDAAYARGLQQAGYATDPDYAGKITRVAASGVLNSTDDTRTA